jgi:osmotically-inducible protein OsmY
MVERATTVKQLVVSPRWPPYVLACWCGDAAFHLSTGGSFMKKTTRILAAAVAAAALAVGSGCAVVRGQEPVGAYVDDATVTTQVKTKLAEDATVSAGAISVETLKGVVQLSGFAKSANEKAQAERLARSVKGVTSVRNDIVVRN